MKKVLFYFHLILVLIISSCKSNSSSTTNKSVTELATPVEDVKLNMDEALVIITKIENDGKNNYLVKVNQMIKRGVGFSANLISGDKIKLKSNLNPLPIEEDTKTTCIIEQAMKINSDNSSFTLKKVIKNN